MTPDKARNLLVGTTPGPWEWSEGKDQNGEFVALRGPDGVTDALRTWDGDLYASGIEGTNADKALAAAAPVLAAMIAGMREEWGVEERHEYTGEWTWHSTHPDRESARDAVNGMDHFRVARRYVTEPEEIS